MDELQKFGLNKNPLTTFLDWYELAVTKEVNAEAMAVATYDEVKKRPNSRILLFKGIQDQNIVFYTNYLSPKSIELSLNPEVALTFYWHESGRQVRIHGKTTRMSKEKSAEYFYTRDRESQIASSISNQSSPIEDKISLLDKFNLAKKNFEGKKIPFPEQWGGFLVAPYEYEFFIYGENRLNDRFVYNLENKIWKITRLQP